jgi:hypothetical protein
MSNKYSNVIKAQKALLETPYLDQLGEQPIEVVFDNQIQAILHKFGDDLVLDIIKSIDEKGLNASKNLTQSINDPLPTVQANGNYQLKIVMADYWEWAETGRNDGKAPPIENIMQWITDKGIKVRKSRSEKLTSVLKRRRSMAFAISRTIAKRGSIKRFNYKGSKFLSDVVNNEAMEDLGVGLAEALGKTVAVSVALSFNPKYNTSI